MSEDAPRWHDKTISIASLVIGCVVTLCSGIAFSVSLAVSLVRDQSRQDLELAIMRDRQNFVLAKDAVQDQRVDLLANELRVVQIQEMALLVSIQQQLAVHEARTGAGVGLQLRGVK